jgi:UDP-glucose 4-epimerase
MEEMKSDLPFIIISGASGFVGSKLIAKLPSEKVLKLTRNPILLKDPLAMTLDEFSLKDTLSCKNLCLVHLASIMPSTSSGKKGEFEENVLYAKKLLNLVCKKKIQRFIYISTGGVYGFHNEPISEEILTAPQDEYSASKLKIEKLVEDIFPSKQLAILRLFFPYGPGQKKTLVPRLIESVRNGVQIQLNTPEGRPFINPIYIDDLVNIIKFFIYEKINGTFNIGGKEIVSIKDLALIIGEKLKAVVNFSNNNNKTSNLVGEIKKINSVFNGQYVSLSDGISRTIEL